ncbi:MAG: zinc-binding alcohol dehydrogenase [Geminicoccaceae bacterium]
MSQVPNRRTSFWVEEPHRGALRHEPFEPGPGPVVRTLFSGISAGTERLVFKGLVPPSQYQIMRAPAQRGDFPAPVAYGYAAVGHVLAGSANLKGRHVFALQPHQSWFSADEPSLVPLPSAVPPDRAVLAANMETALNALWDGEMAGDERVGVIGAGVVGCLIAYLYQRLAGISPEVIDIDPRRVELARGLGLDARLSEQATADRTVLFHASGHGDGLVRALELAAFEGRIVELSWYGSTRVSLPLGERFHAQRLSIISSQVGHVATSKRATVSHRQRLEQALSLLDDPVLDRLISHRVRFEDLPDFMAELATTSKPVMCACVVYPNQTEN